MGRVIAFAPGRVNLIGEHTDYNGGLCLPFAIDQGITVAATPLGVREIEVHARDLGASDRFLLTAIEPAFGWRAYVRGVAAELAAAGRGLTGARLEITSDLPAGGGLASSAALTIATALALLAAAGEEPPPSAELARLCARVENVWAGADTGLMDQLAILCARPAHAARIDLATETVRPVPLALDGWTLWLRDSGVRHEHAAGEYNRRREECRRACELLGIETLRAAGARDPARLPPPLDRRVRHVITENARVERAVHALGRSDLAELGKLLDEGHTSLRDDYETSAPAVDETVAQLRATGAAGARMVGGGFGGQVLALFPPDAVAPEQAMPAIPRQGARML